MDWSTVQTAIVLVLVVIVFFGFVREVLSPDVVALGAVSILLISGILSPDDALSVFSNGAPITVGAMFVLSAALERTGVISVLAQFLSNAANKTPMIAVGSLLLSVALTSAFVNNTPIVVLMTPVVIGLAQTAQDGAVEASDPAFLRQHLRRHDHPDRHLDQHPGRRRRADSRHQADRHVRDHGHGRDSRRLRAHISVPGRPLASAEPGDSGEPPAQGIGPPFRHRRPDPDRFAADRQAAERSRLHRGQGLSGDRRHAARDLARLAPEGHHPRSRRPVGHPQQDGRHAGPARGRRRQIRHAATAMPSSRSRRARP